MPDLIAQLVAALESAPANPAAADRALIDAAFVLEKARGLPDPGWPAAVRAARLNPGQADALKAAVAAYVERFARGCWTLGKAADPVYAPVLAEALRRHLQPGGDVAELYQALIALEDCGAAHVFGGAMCRSVMHAAANRQYARACLDRLDLVAVS